MAAWRSTGNSRAVLPCCWSNGPRSTPWVQAGLRGEESAVKAAGAGESNICGSSILDFSRKDPVREGFSNSKAQLSSRTKSTRDLDAQGCAKDAGSVNLLLYSHIGSVLLSNAKNPQYFASDGNAASGKIRRSFHLPLRSAQCQGQDDGSTLYPQKIAPGWGRRQYFGTISVQLGPGAFAELVCRAVLPFWFT